MPEKSSDQIGLFVRDAKTGRYVFNAKALQALGVDPANARDRGYLLEQFEETEPDLTAIVLDAVG